MCMCFYVCVRALCGEHIIRSTCMCVCVYVCMCVCVCVQALCGEHIIRSTCCREVCWLLFGTNKLAHRDSVEI